MTATGWPASPWELAATSGSGTALAATPNTLQPAGASVSRRSRRHDGAGGSVGPRRKILMGPSLMELKSLVQLLRLRLSGGGVVSAPAVEAVQVDQDLPSP